MFSSLRFSLAGEDHLSSPSGPGLSPALAGSVTPAGPPVLPPPECLMLTVNRCALPASLTTEAPGEGRDSRSLRPEKGLTSRMRGGGERSSTRRETPHTHTHRTISQALPPSSRPPTFTQGAVSPRRETAEPVNPLGPQGLGQALPHRPPPLRATECPGRLHTVFPQAKAGPSGPRTKPACIPDPSGEALGACKGTYLSISLLLFSLLPQNRPQYLHVAINIYQRLTGFLDHFTSLTTSLFVKPSPFLRAVTSHLPLLPPSHSSVSCWDFGGQGVLQGTVSGTLSSPYTPGRSHPLPGFLL